ncbi:MAG: hypothetical protein SVY10_21520 [Thermodesulfobacteriota bacterium]|nr:hypothetical protein [Thermodesulfobacteriota bacterium]
MLKKVKAKEYDLAWAVDFSPDGNRIIVGINEEYTLKLLDVNTGQEIQFFDIVWNIRKVSFSDDGKYVLSISTYDPPSI